MTSSEREVTAAVPAQRSAPGLAAAARARLAALADLMIPAGDGMPAASGAGVAGTGVDHLLRVRPDLAQPLVDALDFSPGADPAAVLHALRTERPAVFAALGELVAGAYYLDPTVAGKVGYHGRAALPVDPDDVDRDDVAALRQPVVDRGPIYRPDPRSVDS
jgi:hypothetical protein